MKILYCKTSFAGQISGADEIAVNYATEMKARGDATAVLLVHAPVKEPAQEVARFTAEPSSYAAGTLTVVADENEVRDRAARE